MNELLNSTRIHAPADGRGSGGNPPKRTARERALFAFEKAIDKDDKAEERAEAARRKAIGEVFTTFIEGADEETVIAVFAGLEVPSTKANRKRIAAHPSALRRSMRSSRSASRKSSASRPRKRPTASAKRPKKRPSGTARRAMSPRRSLIQAIHPSALRFLRRAANPPDKT